MQTPRDLSKRMLEAAEQTPVIDVYERLLPESARTTQRHDLFSWFLACAADQITALGLSESEQELLGQINAPPLERWNLFAARWPGWRATGLGRAVLRAVWELFHIEEINERTWKDISAYLWKSGAAGMYELLLRQAQIRHVLVARPVGEATPGTNWLSDIEPLIWPTERADLGPDGSCTNLGQLEELLRQVVSRNVEQGCLAFTLARLPDAVMLAPIQAQWALGRLLGRESDNAAAEPALSSYLLHRLMSALSGADRPLMVQVSQPAQIERLAAWLDAYPQARLVALYRGGDPFPLMSLACRRPHLMLGVGDLWRTTPFLACHVLKTWIQGLPWNRLLGISGGAVVIEMICAQAWIAREHLAAMLAEMVAHNELDEQDAVTVLRYLLGQNAQQYFDLDD